MNLGIFGEENDLPPPPKCKESWKLSTDRIKGVKHTLANPSDVAFIDESTLVLADSESHQLSIYDIDGNLLSSLASEKVWPNCVACNKWGNIVCTDRQSRRTKIFDAETGTCLQTIGEELWDGEFEIELRPSGVAIDSHGQVIITDTQLHKVLVYSPEGKKLREFGGKGQRSTQMLCPFYLAVDTRDNIIVSDNMNYAIKKFDNDGNYLLKIGSGQDWGQRSFQSPYGVCVDRYGKTLVADYESNRVTMYTEDGDLLGDVVSKKDCRNPTGLTMNRQGDLVITENNAEYSNLKLFHLEYDSSLIY